MRGRRRPAPADAPRPRRGRDREPPARHARAVRRALRVRAQGRHARRGRLARSRVVRAPPPALVGNRSHVLVSELSGRATIREVAEEHGLELDEDEIARALERLKDLEHRGYAFEAADASFELLLRAEAGAIEPLLTLESFRVIVEKQGGGPRRDRGDRQAARPRRAGRDRGEGNGPVHALDHALRRALEDHYPELATVELSNYKVRILDPDSGTGAVTRVILESRGGHDAWSTVGVSANIIEASWEALVEGLTVRRCAYVSPAPSPAAA